VERQLIIQDWCWQVYADPEAGLMEAYWLEQAKLEGQAFRDYLDTWATLIEQNRPLGFLVDSRRGHLAMTPDIQDWHDSQIVPRYIAAGVRKVAFILPEDVFAALSIELMFDEKESRKLATQYFDDSDKALVWLRG
jgi:hypothetical protein